MNTIITETSAGRLAARKAGKEQAIIESAKELFTTAGFEATTISDVARKAGVAVGTVYLYFKNKSELLTAVRDTWEMELLKVMADPLLQALPLSRRTRPLVEASFKICAEQVEMIQLMRLPAHMVGEMYDYRGGVTIIDALEEMFRAGVEAGEIRAVDPHMAAVLSYSMVNGALEHCFLVGDGRDKEAYIDALVDAIEEWLGITRQASELGK